MISDWIGGEGVAINIPLPLMVIFGKVARGVRVLARAVVAPMAAARAVVVFMMY